MDNVGRGMDNVGRGTMHRAPTKIITKNNEGRNMTYKPTIHHRRSIRLKGYDYSQPGAYFITICTVNRDHLFGEVHNGKMVLNEQGIIAKNEWLKTPEMRPNIQLSEFVVMPNHFHGIIVIIDVGRGTNNVGRRGTMHRAPTNVIEQFGKPTSNTIPTIIRGFKSTVTKQINIIRDTPGVPLWQRNYYEHIIRREEDHHYISEYIVNNPINWLEDDYYYR